MKKPNKNWKSGRIKRSGVYIFQTSENEDYEFEVLDVCCVNGDWLSSDFPCHKVTEPFANDGKQPWIRLL